MKRVRLAQRRKAVGLTQEGLAQLLRIDTTTVRRWEAGRTEPLPWMRPRIATALKLSTEALARLLQDSDNVGSEEHDHLEMMAAVLADAWAIPTRPEVIGPQPHEVKALPTGHLRFHAGERTLKELGIFVRYDMLTRRDTLAQAVKVLSGPALLAPIAGWLGDPPDRMLARDHGTQRVGASDVAAIERSTRFFAATDADIGGALSREAAVGQLKYAVDLARYGSYNSATGERLLAVIAELSGLAGWLSHDSGMSGPAQKYFTYGLRAARQSADPRARLLVVSILDDMAEHLRWLGHPESALDLCDLAFSQLPADRRFDALRGLLTVRRAANGLCHLGRSRIAEVRDALSRSFGLYRQASDDDKAAIGTMWHRVMDAHVSELAAPAATSCLVLAEHDPRLAADAEKYTMDQIAGVPEGRGRSEAFGRIRLARIRFLAGEAEQACDDGDQALNVAEHMKSATVRARLRELLSASEPYAAGVPRVREFRDRLRGAIARLN